MTKIKSDNIVKLFDFQETKNCFYIIEELCDCDLSKIMKYNKIISEAKAI
jgi:serine/threonine protein kinase